MNRKFYKISFYSYDRIPCNSISAEQKRESFKKNYLCGSKLKYTYLFNYGCLDEFFFYYENGYFYEFFSGYCLGQLNGTHNISGELPLHISISEKYSDHLVYQLSDSQFAFDVNPYLKHKERIAKSMNKYFELLHYIWLIDKRKEEKRQQQANQRESFDTSTINYFLNKREKTD